jgi:acetyl-CoA acetyltransferase
MRPVAITGVGMTAFATHLGRSLTDLGAEAVIAALIDADLRREDIGAVYVGHMTQGELCGQRVLKELDFPPLPVTNIENACASGAYALQAAWLAVVAGAVDSALVVGIGKVVLDKGKSAAIRLSEPPLDHAMGQTVVGAYAAIGQHHMLEYGTKPEHFARISEKNHANGVDNPSAMFRRAYSLSEIMQSRMIADPVTLLQCCEQASGAAALVISQPKRMQGRSPICIRACELAAEMNRGRPEPDMAFAATRAAVRRAYERAGLGPGDLDVVELHDAVSVAELVAYEALGICPRGEGARLVDEGATARGGRIPVNPSGGLIARGHPAAATGIAQVIELVLQLRGAAGARQVPGATVALAQCHGHLDPGTGAAAVTILSR